MRAIHLLLGVGLLAASGCPLQRVSGSVGRDCDDTSDCDDDALACVLTDIDDPTPDYVCMLPPDGWICPGKFYRDIDAMCDCGCGIIDVDCANASAASCDENNCESGDPLPNNNADCG